MRQVYGRRKEMNKTISLPLFQMSDGSAVDLRRVWCVEPIKSWSEGDNYFRVNYGEGMHDTFKGEEKWLKIERENLIDNWNKVVGISR